MKIKIILIIVSLVVILGALVYLNNREFSGDNNLETTPSSNNEILDEPLLEETEDTKNKEKEEQEVSGDENSNKEDVFIVDKKLSCEKDGGVWFDYNSSCEINSLSQNECLAKGGEYNECNSACRHDKEAIMCTLQCVMTCTFK